MVFGLFGIHWVMPHKVIGMFNCWLGKLSSRGLCHIVCVGVFDRNENARCFEDCERSILHIKSIFFLTLLEWSLVLPVISCISLPVLIDYCNLDS